MTNFFGFSYTFPTGMNNWFMPNWLFSGYFNPFGFNYFNSFNNWYMPNWSCFENWNPFNNWFTSLNYTNNNYSDSVFHKSVNSPSNFYKSNTDTFTRSSEIDYAKDDLKLDGYNEKKGKRLANIALNNSSGWTGYCARQVKNDIQQAGLGRYEYGHAYQMTDILRKNKNFKEISPDDVKLKDLPEGCVLVYGKGVEGYSDNYGHTEITALDKETGKTIAVSDGITKNLHKKPSAIFIPV